MVVSREKMLSPFHARSTQFHPQMRTSGERKKTDGEESGDDDNLIVVVAGRPL